MTNKVLFIVVAVCLLIGPGCTTWKMKASSSSRTMKCFHVATPPVIDGVPDEPAWKGAEWVSLDHKIGVAPTNQEAVRVAFLWDALSLYFAATVPDAFTLAKCAKRDDDIWDDDCVEIFIDPQRKGKTYYEFEFNANGVLWDSFVTFDKARVLSDNLWDSKTLVVKTRKRPGGWDLEGRISLYDFRTSNHLVTQPGDRWRINIYRIDQFEDGTYMLYAWSPTPEFHKPANFGEMVFEFPELKKDLAEKKQRAAEFFASSDMTRAGKLLDRLPSITAEIPGGEKYTYDAEKQRWHAAQRWGSVWPAKNQDIPGVFSVHPHSGKEPTQIRWTTSAPGRIVVLAKIGPGGVKGINSGGADGTVVRATWDNGKKSDIIQTFDGDWQMIEFETTGPDEIRIAVEAGPAEHLHCDSTMLSVFELPVKDAKVGR